MDNGEKWSNLPQELLRMIGKFMDTRIDVARFRAVCPSWQSSISPPPVISLKPPLRSNDSLEIIPNGYLPLVGRTIYRIEPCEENPNPWTLFGSAPSPSSKGAFLFQVEEEEAQGMRLLTPLSGSPIQPPVNPEGLNLLSFGLSEICTYFYFKIPLMMGNTAIRKVIVSCSNSFMANENDYAIMGVDYAKGSMQREVNGSLYFYRSGEVNWSVMHEMEKGQFYWLHLEDFNSFDCCDLITYKGKFYVLECRGRTIVIDPLTKKVSTIVPEDMWNFQGYEQMHLVESSGHLLFVGRDWSSERGTYEEYLDMFHVYKLDEEEGKWVEIKSLGDQALFVSNCVSFSVSARDYVGYKENCIYYYSDLYATFTSKDDNDILLMFNFEDGSTRLLQPGDVFF